MFLELSFRGGGEWPNDAWEKFKRHQPLYGCGDIFSTCIAVSIARVVSLLVPRHLERAWPVEPRWSFAG